MAFRDWDGLVSLHLHSLLEEQGGFIPSSRKKNLGRPGLGRFFGFIGLGTNLKKGFYTFLAGY